MCLPDVVGQVCLRVLGFACQFSWSITGQGGMRAMLIVVILELRERLLEIVQCPKENVIQEFPSDCTD